MDFITFLLLMAATAVLSSVLTMMYRDWRWERWYYRQMAQRRSFWISQGPNLAILPA